MEITIELRPVGAAYPDAIPLDFRAHARPNGQVTQQQEFGDRRRILEVSAGLSCFAWWSLQVWTQKTQSEFAGVCFGWFE